MISTIFNIVAFASMTNLFIESHPMIMMKKWLFKKIRNSSFFNCNLTYQLEVLFSCAMCSGFWIGLISNLIVCGEFSILVASITSIVSELINQKLNKSI